MIVSLTAIQGRHLYGRQLAVLALNDKLCNRVKKDCCDASQNDRLPSHTYPRRERTL